jgi:hypothetical protein
MAGPQMSTIEKKHSSSTPFAGPILVLHQIQRGSVSNLGQFEEFARRLDEIAAQVPQVRLNLHNTHTSV